MSGRRSDGRAGAAVAVLASLVLLGPLLFGPLPARSDAPSPSPTPQPAAVAAAPFVPVSTHDREVALERPVITPPAKPVTPPTHTPVLFLHGALLGPGCVGTNPAGVASALHAVLARHHWTGKLLPVDYYCGDAGPGTVDIRNGTRPTADTSITDIAGLLAWYVYRTYSSKGIAVDLVGHSMGGLIMRDALNHVGQHGFPPFLLVRDAVTISAPFGGIPARAVCPLQCRQMLTGSDYLAGLNAKPSAPSGQGGTGWTVLGGSPCDYIPAASTLSLRGAMAVDFAPKAAQCYTHVTYLSDTSARQDLRTVISAVSGAQHMVTGPHALEWVYRGLIR